MRMLVGLNFRERHHLHRSEFVWFVQREGDGPGSGDRLNAIASRPAFPRRPDAMFDANEPGLEPIAEKNEIQTRQRHDQRPQENFFSGKVHKKCG
jgi:hypothetical protein